MKYVVIFLVFLAVSLSSVVQAQIVFNRTEHDFGEISTSQHSFEQDFIFRNTGTSPIKILSVKTVSTSLSFVHTRSEVLSKEYGFVKVKLLTEESNGLFHDEVYITLKQGDELLSEVLYVRANISDDGVTQERQFQDGIISTSVEVSPEDIETMEGFMGDDKLKKAESELVYLKKQVSLKDELISKLSSDLYQQEEEKSENLERLVELEKTLQSDDANNSEAVAQIQELSVRLRSMKSSDSLLRMEIDSQEELFAQLQEQADSLRNIIASVESGSQNHQAEINSLKQQISRTERNKNELSAEASELEGKLKNAHLSNEIVFNELKSEVNLIRDERDDYRGKYRDALKEINMLNEALAESRNNEANLKAFVNEMEDSPRVKPRSAATGVVFRVSFRTSKSRLSTTSFPDIREDIFEYKENEKYRYAAGELAEINSAFALKNKLKSQGYHLAAIVAFRDGKRITLKEALETAAN